MISNNECEQNDNRDMLHKLLDESLASMKEGGGLPADKAFAELEKIFKHENI